MVMSKKEKHPGLTDKYWVTQHNFLEEVRNQFTLPEQVHIHDVTLREAEQAPHVVLRPEEKLRIYEALDEMGVYSVEIFPLVSDDDKEVAKELVKMRRKTKRRYSSCAAGIKKRLILPLKREPMESLSKARRIPGLRRSHSME